MNLTTRLGEIARWCVRRILRLYYPRIEVEGRERLPASGAVLLVANHPNSLMDPALIGFATRRPVHFFAKAPLFDVPVFCALMRALGMVPAYRGQEIVRAALQAMYRVYEDHWHIEADTHSTLQALHQAGVHLGLISNAGDDSNVQRLIDNASIRPYFEVILTSAAQGIRKPNPRIFHTALNHLAVQPARAAMVGDTLGADILGARNAGIYSVWITRRADTPANHAHLDTIQPDATVATLAD